MLTCALFDVMAKVPLNVIRGPFWTSERMMAQELIKDLQAGDLLLLIGAIRVISCSSIWSNRASICRTLASKWYVQGRQNVFGLRKKRWKNHALSTKNTPQRTSRGNLAPLKLRIIKIAVPAPQNLSSSSPHYWIGKNSRPPNSEIFTISDGIKRSSSKPSKNTSMPNNSTAAASNSSIKNSSLFIYTTL